MDLTIFSRNALLSAISCACFMAMAQGCAQNASAQSFDKARLVPAVFGGSIHSGWYSYPGEQPRLNFNGDAIRITSSRQSTVLLSREPEPGGADAQVSLTRAPLSTSSISGLAVMSDARHALVIGLADGGVVLWQLDPAGARLVARQPVNASSTLEFRVTGEDAASIRFFWRHPGDGAWHPLGDPSANEILTGWQKPLRFGLLLDGPLGSQVIFRNYRTAARSNVAFNFAPSGMVEHLVSAQ